MIVVKSQLEIWYHFFRNRLLQFIALTTHRILIVSRSMCWYKWCQIQHMKLGHISGSKIHLPVNIVVLIKLLIQRWMKSKVYLELALMKFLTLNSKVIVHNWIRDLTFLFKGLKSQIISLENLMKIPRLIFLGCHIILKIRKEFIKKHYLLLSTSIYFTQTLNQFGCLIGWTLKKINWFTSLDII